MARGAARHLLSVVPLVLALVRAFGEIVVLRPFIGGERTGGPNGIELAPATKLVAKRDAAVRPPGGSGGAHAAIQCAMKAITTIAPSIDADRAKVGTRRRW